METFRPCSGKGETNASPPPNGDLEPVTVVRRAVGTRAFTTRILYVNFACRLLRLFTTLCDTMEIHIRSGVPIYGVLDCFFVSVVL